MFRQQLLQTSKKFFSVSLQRSNAISELYLKELKSVKLPEVNIADANVKPFTPLKVSEYANDLASSKDALKAYESEPVEVLKAVQESEDAGAAAEEDWLVIEEEVEEEHH